MLRGRMQHCSDRAETRTCDLELLAHFSVSCLMEPVIDRLKRTGTASVFEDPDIRSLPSNEFSKKLVPAFQALMALWCLCVTERRNTLNRPSSHS